jgi:uncharacterized Zn finger protein (UPF0148 family)
MPRPIEIQKPLLGSYVVSYGCPHCDSHLKSPVEDIGKADFCPDCNRQFVVPGAKEWQISLDSQKAAANAREVEKHAKAAAREVEKHARAVAVEAEKQARRLKEEQEERQRIAREQSEAARHLGTPTSQPPPQEIVRAELVPSGPFPTSQTRRCPYCSEEILASAIKCKHCGEFLDGRSRQSAPQPVPVYYQQPAQGGSGCGLIITIALGIVLGVILLMFL